MSITAHRRHLPQSPWRPSEWTVLLVLVLASGVLAFFPAANLGPPRLVGETLDAFHFPAGVILSWWLARSLVEIGRTPEPMVVLGVSLVFIGAVELVQYFIGREADLKDAITGALGATYGVATGPPIAASLRLGRSRSIFGCLVLTLTLLAPCLLDWTHVARMKLNPGVISDFEWFWSDRAWQPQWGTNSHSPEISIVRGDWPKATRALKVRIEKSGWSGVSIELPRTNDAFRGIGLTVNNPGGEFHLIVQLTFADRRENRRIVETQISVGPGAHSFRLKSAQLSSNENGGALISVLLYAKEAAGSRTFYLDDVIRL